MGKLRKGTIYLAINCITIFKATTTNDYLVVSCFVCLEVELWLLHIGGLLDGFTASSVVIVMAVTLDLVIFVFAVILQRQSVSLRVLGFGVNELQVVLVGANFDRV